MPTLTNHLRRVEVEASRDFFYFFADPSTYKDKMAHATRLFAEAITDVVGGSIDTDVSASRGEEEVVKQQEQSIAQKMFARFISTSDPNTFFNAVLNATPQAMTAYADKYRTTGFALADFSGLELEDEPLAVCLQNLPVLEAMQKSFQEDRKVTCPYSLITHIVARLYVYALSKQGMTELGKGVDTVEILNKFLAKVRTSSILTETARFGSSSVNPIFAHTAGNDFTVAISELSSLVENKKIIDANKVACEQLSTAVTSLSNGLRAQLLFRLGDKAKRYATQVSFKPASTLSQFGKLAVTLMNYQTPGFSASTPTYDVYQFHQFISSRQAILPINNVLGITDPRDVQAVFAQLQAYSKLNLLAEMAKQMNTLNNLLGWTLYGCKVYNLHAIKSQIMSVMREIRAVELQITADVQANAHFDKLRTECSDFNAMRSAMDAAKKAANSISTLSDEAKISHVRQQIRESLHSLSQLGQYLNTDLVNRDGVDFMEGADYFLSRQGEVQKQELEEAHQQNQKLIRSLQLLRTTTAELVDGQLANIGAIQELRKRAGVSEQSYMLESMTSRQQVSALQQQADESFRGVFEELAVQEDEIDADEKAAASEQEERRQQALTAAAMERGASAVNSVASTGRDQQAARIQQDRSAAPASAVAQTTPENKKETTADKLSRLMKDNSGKDAILDYLKALEARKTLGSEYEGFFSGHGCFQFSMHCVGRYSRTEKEDALAAFADALETNRGSIAAALSHLEKNDEVSFGALDGGKLGGVIVGAKLAQMQQAVQGVPPVVTAQRSQIAAKG